jgi:dihydroneopterin aldolase
MKIKSKLLEHVSERIIASVHSSFPEIKRIEVKVSKMNPPMVEK